MRIERLFAGGDLPRQGPDVFDTASTGGGALEAHRKVRDASLRQYAAIIRGQGEITEARQARFAADGRFGQSVQAAGVAIAAEVAATRKREQADLAAQLDRQRREGEAATQASRIERLFEDGVEKLVGAIQSGRTAPDGSVPEPAALQGEMIALRNSALDSVPGAGTRSMLEPRLNTILQGSGPQILRATEKQRIAGQRQEADASLAALARRAAGSGDPMARWQRLMDGFTLVESLNQAGVYDGASAERKKLAFRATLARGALRSDIAANPEATLAALDAGGYDALIGEENRGPWADAATQARAAREAQAAQGLRLRQAGAASELARAVASGAVGLPEVEAADLAPADRGRLRRQAERLTAQRHAAARDIDRIEDCLAQGGAFDMADAGLLRALDSHYAAVARPWVQKPDADAPQRLAAYADRLGAVPPALAGDVLDSLQAGKPEQMVLAAETLDRVTAAVPGSLSQFPDGAALRAHLIVALTDAGLTPADAVARTETVMTADAATRDARRPDGEAAAAAPRNRSFLTRAWADAAEDADALPEPAQDRFTALFTEGYAATADERVARALAFKRLLGEIGGGKGKDWVGEEDTDEGGAESRVLQGGIGEDRFNDLARSMADGFGVGGAESNKAFDILNQLLKQARKYPGLRRALDELDHFARNGSQPKKSEPENPNLPSAPRSGETRPLPKPEEAGPEPEGEPQEKSPRIRPEEIANIARGEVERERQKRKDERATRRNAGKSNEPPTPLQRRIADTFRGRFQESGRSKISLDVRDVAADAVQSDVIKEFVHAEADGSLVNAGEQVAELRLDEISSDAVTRVLEKSGGKHDLSGKRHALPSDRMRHALNRHGVGNEKDPRQEPITPEDIAAFTEIVNQADKVNHIRTRGDRSVSIEFEKRVNGTYVIVEMLRKDDLLEFYSMRKVKAH